MIFTENLTVGNRTSSSVQDGLPIWQVLSVEQNDVIERAHLTTERADNAADRAHITAERA
ncbi:UNVERIFIED_CONTAM: hypothetical protein DES50_110127 [Williamsia faeni]